MHTVLEFLQWFTCVKMVQQIRRCRCDTMLPAPQRSSQQLRGWGRWRWREYDESRAKEDVSRFKVLGQVRWGWGVGVVGVSSPRCEAWADRNSSVWAPAGLEWMWSWFLRRRSASSCRYPLNDAVHKGSLGDACTHLLTHTFAYFRSSGGLSLSFS